jgi:hypothetical protein
LWNIEPRITTGGDILYKQKNNGSVPVDDCVTGTLPFLFFFGQGYDGIDDVL